MMNWMNMKKLFTFSNQCTTKKIFQKRLDVESKKDMHKEYAKINLIIFYLYSFSSLLHDERVILKFVQQWYHFVNYLKLKSLKYFFLMFKIIERTNRTTYSIHKEA
jgi:hypothetical protein